MIKHTQNYSFLIKNYIFNLKKTYNIITKHYKDIYVFEDIPLLDYSLAIANKLIVYDENIITCAMLYNPYKYNLDLNSKNYSKIIKKISKDIYFLNFYDLVHNPFFSAKKIKEMIVQSFFKIEAVVVLFGEALVILDYFPVIKDKVFKKRFLEIIEQAIYPLSYQLGMHNFKECFLNKLVELKYTKVYERLNTQVTKKFPPNNLETLKSIVMSSLKAHNLKPLTYNYRYKSVGSLFQKVFVKKDKTSIGDVLDIYAIRLIYNTKKECYRALTFLKKYFVILDTEKTGIRDYIKSPKPNGYQSIHLNILLNNYPIEIQIRTADMHNNAEFGVSAHYHYKNIEYSEKDARTIDFLKEKSMVEKNKDTSYKDYVSVYTQTDQEVFLPKKSTLLDFAFFLHTDFVKFFEYAEVNFQKVYDKGYALKNGDKVKLFRTKDLTLKKSDIDYLFDKKNKRKFNSLAHSLFD